MPERDQQPKAALRFPWVRAELLAELRELAANDPRPIWEQARAEGRTAGIDDVFHFFFDDHVFGDSDVGVCLWSAQEVVALGEVKAALQHLLDALGDVGDEEFVTHPDWMHVAGAAGRALERLESPKRPQSTLRRRS